MSAGRRGLLIVLSGPSGVGKDTVIRELIKRDPSIRYSVSYTTRPPRPGEVDGEHYNFVDEVEFARMVERGDFLEHAIFNGQHYGTSAATVEQALAAGQDILLKIEVVGASQVRRKCPDGLFVFLAPPSMEELLRRRQARDGDQGDVRERQRIAEWEMGFMPEYQHVVINDSPERAVKELLEIIERRRQALVGG